jgi:pyrroloquinoline-quinone synthase
VGRYPHPWHQTHFEIGLNFQPQLNTDETRIKNSASLIRENLCESCGFKPYSQKLMNKYLDEIDNDIAAKHLLKHPFYLAWARGELTKAALADYARQYYHHVAAFPMYLSAVHAKCEDQTTRKELLNNLIDEEAGSPNHPELWLQFAEGLGVSDVEARNTTKEPETKNLIDTFRSVCGGGSTAEGVAALYAYESQIPTICESKIDGLKEHYGFSNPEHYQYFSVHLEADREHSGAERKMLERRVDQHNFNSVKASVNRVLDALWEMLSGVCRRHAIAC